jgi:hypothetical protein
MSLGAGRQFVDARPRLRQWNLCGVALYGVAGIEEEAEMESTRTSLRGTILASSHLRLCSSLTLSPQDHTHYSI